MPRLEKAIFNVKNTGALRSPFPVTRSHRQAITKSSSSEQREPVFTGYGTLPPKNGTPRSNPKLGIIPVDLVTQQFTPVRPVCSPSSTRSAEYPPPEAQASAQDQPNIMPKTCSGKNAVGSILKESLGEPSPSCGEKGATERAKASQGKTKDHSTRMVERSATAQPFEEDKENIVPLEVEPETIDSQPEKQPCQGEDESSAGRRKVVFIQTKALGIKLRTNNMKRCIEIMCIDQRAPKCVRSSLSVGDCITNVNGFEASFLSDVSPLKDAILGGIPVGTEISLLVEPQSQGEECSSTVSAPSIEATEMRMGLRRSARLSNEPALKKSVESKVKVKNKSKSVGQGNRSSPDIPRNNSSLSKTSTALIHTEPQQLRRSSRLSNEPSTRRTLAGMKSQQYATPMVTRRRSDSVPSTKSSNASRTTSPDPTSQSDRSCMDSPIPIEGSVRLDQVSGDGYSPFHSALSSSISASHPKELASSECKGQNQERSVPKQRRISSRIEKQEHEKKGNELEEKDAKKNDHKQWKMTNWEVQVKGNEYVTLLGTLCQDFSGPFTWEGVVEERLSARKLRTKSGNVVHLQGKPQKITFGSNDAAAPKRTRQRKENEEKLVKQFACGFPKDWEGLLHNTGTSPVSRPASTKQKRKLSDRNPESVHDSESTSKRQNNQKVPVKSKVNNSKLTSKRQKNQKVAVKSKASTKPTAKSTVACNNCRKSKKKCDRKIPQCGNCRKTTKIKCQYASAQHRHLNFRSDKKKANALNGGQRSHPVVKATRSGRKCVSVLDWWRNQRLVSKWNGDSLLTLGDNREHKKKKGPKRKAEKEIDSDSWSDIQLTQLREAHNTTDPVKGDFWGNVAKQVDGKSPLQCHEKWFEKYATPKIQSKREEKTNQSHLKKSSMKKGNVLKNEKKVRIQSPSSNQHLSFSRGTSASNARTLCQISDGFDDVFQATPKSGQLRSGPNLCDSLLTLVDDGIAMKKHGRQPQKSQNSSSSQNESQKVMNNSKVHGRYLSKLAKQIKKEQKREKKSDAFSNANIEKRNAKIRARTQKGNTFSIAGCLTPRGTINISEKVNSEGDEYLSSSDDEPERDRA